MISTLIPTPALTAPPTRLHWPAQTPGPGRSRAPADGAARLMIPVSELAAHPGNVRDDLDLTAEFCASIAEAGVRVPLLITPTADGGYRVIEGHRRLAAALKAGLAEVPCDTGPGPGRRRGGPVPGHAARQQRRLPPELRPRRGSRRAVRRARGGRHPDPAAQGHRPEGRGDQDRPARQRRSPRETRAAAGDLARQLTLDELALLAEFDGDAGAICSGSSTALRRGYNVEYAAERIRQDRAEAAEHERLLDRAGSRRDHGHRRPARRAPSGWPSCCTTVRTSPPKRTPPARAAACTSCPGTCCTPCTTAPAPSRARPHVSRAACWPSPPPERPAATRQRRRAGAWRSPVPADEPPDPARRLVIEGNKAWKAAAEVRKRWLADVLFARRTAPREAAAVHRPAAADHAGAAALRPGHRAGRLQLQRDHRAGRGAGGWRSATPPRRPGSRC